MTKDQFKTSWSNGKKEYLVGRDNHCYYVKKVKRNGEVLCCLNSWGDQHDPKPKINTQTVKDYDIFSVDLICKPSEEDLHLVSTLNSNSVLQDPSVAKLDQLGKLAR